MLNYNESKIFLKRADNEVEELAGKSLDCMLNTSGYAFEICEQLTRTISALTNQECDAYILGEIAMGISNESTKMQVFLDVGRNNYYAPRDYKKNFNDIKTIQKWLSKDPNFKVLRINPHLPSLNVCLRSSNDVCEISVTNGLSVQLSCMIGHFFTIQPEAIKFYHFIRLWLKINGVKFKTFNVALLVIHYLQTSNFMPSAYRAQKNIQLEFIEDCATSFDSGKTISDYGIKKLHYYYSYVRSFFRYYAKFDYKNNVVSTYYGYAMRKTDHPKLDYYSPIIIPAFINQRSNSSHRVSSAELDNFINICIASYDFLDNDL
ncbi:hypothetical protein PVAND_006486 [Polypedilum vanderplanki]|uniref:PAP-associated domain-containing protein n=1 Tax=Polypedilum vanderplanki TaxID=319348 RepID=A0A9J6C3B4_POLVA|nr:hypothetical protein PVAND_006486 [Polypedilum vanderplanki]